MAPTFSAGSLVRRAVQRNVMALSRGLLPLAAMLALVGLDVRAESITDARYVSPVERYGHFALGRPHEYAGLTATTSAGRTLTLQLPEDDVFEDLAPRIVRLTPTEPPEILAIVSNRRSGSRLVLIRSNREGLAIAAQSSAIGTPMRWLNPVGVADLDGDGLAEIAAVITPHVGGTLKVYRRREGKLVEIAALPGFSNHVLGSRELSLSAPVLIAGSSFVLVPDTARVNLRVIALAGDQLVEKGRCALSAPVTGGIEPVSPHEISIGLASGRRVIDPKACMRNE